MIPHKEEYYCAVKSTREGSEILVANCGGIEVESNWDRVKRLALDIGQQPSARALEKLGQGCGLYWLACEKDGRFCRQDVHLFR